MCWKPITMNSVSTISLTATMMLFARALSLTPSISSHVMNATIAKAGQRATGPKQKKERYESRPGADEMGVAGCIILPRRSRSNRPKNAGANHRPNRKHDQVARTEYPLQSLRILAFRQKLGDRLSR